MTMNVRQAVPVRIDLDQGMWPGNGMLLCPNCGGHCLHHEGVTVFDRDEDAKVTTVSTVKDGRVVQSQENSEACGNPSKRRDGLAVHFSCELCPAISELTISQHKGSTYTEWRLVGWRKKSHHTGLA